MEIAEQNSNRNIFLTSQCIKIIKNISKDRNNFNKVYETIKRYYNRENNIIEIKPIKGTNNKIKEIKNPGRFWMKDSNNEKIILYAHFGHSDKYPDSSRENSNTLYKKYFLNKDYIKSEEKFKKYINGYYIHSTIPSEYQNNNITEFEKRLKNNNNQNNKIINIFEGFAGTGKTSTSVWLIDSLYNKFNTEDGIIFIVPNKDLADKIKIDISIRYKYLKDKISLYTSDKLSKKEFPQKGCINIITTINLYKILLNNSNLNFFSDKKFLLEFNKYSNSSIIKKHLNEIKLKPRHMFQIITAFIKNNYNINSSKKDPIIKYYSNIVEKLKKKDQFIITYDILKKQINYKDIYDIVNEISNNLSSNKLNKYTDKLKNMHIFVDECQDLLLEEIELILELFIISNECKTNSNKKEYKRTSLNFIGDNNQRIKITNFIFSELSKLINNIQINNDFKSTKLQYNYRSPFELAKFIEIFTERLNDSIQEKHKGSRHFESPIPVKDNLINLSYKNCNNYTNKPTLIILSHKNIIKFIRKIIKCIKKRNSNKNDDERKINIIYDPENDDFKSNSEIKNIVEQYYNFLVFKTPEDAKGQEFDGVIYYDFPYMNIINESNSIIHYYNWYTGITRSFGQSVFLMTEENYEKFNKFMTDHSREDNANWNKNFIILDDKILKDNSTINDIVDSTYLKFKTREEIENYIELKIDELENTFSFDRLYDIFKFMGILKNSYKVNKSDIKFYIEYMAESISKFLLNINKNSDIKKYDDKDNFLKDLFIQIYSKYKSKINPIILIYLYYILTGKVIEKFCPKNNKLWEHELIINFKEDLTKKNFEPYYWYLNHIYDRLADINKNYKRRYAIL